MGNDYGLPKAGGERFYTYYIRLSSADTDTIDAHVVYGELSDDACPIGFRYFKSADFRYNGQPSGTYHNGYFYSGSLDAGITFRKRP